jgi:bifunctional enzyme CysN/CysC
MGHAVAVLDGGAMRKTVSRGLGFTASERSENLRRAADVARLLNDAGLICICAFVAPNEGVRRKARQAIGRDRFVEVYVNAPVETCRERDSEGMYSRADAGEIADYPGVTAPYQVSASPELSLDTRILTVDECVERVVDRLAPWLSVPG